MAAVKKLKTETIAIRVTPEEKEKIQELAAMAEMTVSKYLYSLVFGETSAK